MQDHKFPYKKAQKPYLFVQQHLLPYFQDGNAIQSLHSEIKCPGKIHSFLKQIFHSLCLTQFGGTFSWFSSWHQLISAESKVQLFWEGHKNGFDIYLLNIKTMRNIAQIFVAFSEKLNFTTCFSLELNVKMRRTLWEVHKIWKKSPTFISNVKTSGRFFKKTKYIQNKPPVIIYD